MNVENPYEPELGSIPRETEETAGRATETGTTSVGVTTAEGAVLATDRRASLGGRVVSNKHVQKVEQVHDTAALTLVGSVGGAQAFVRSIRAEANLYEARRGRPMSINALATIASNFARGPFLLINPVLGGVDETGPHVFTIDPMGGRSEDEYVVTGSGMQFALGVLEQDWEADATLEEGVTVAARAVQSASERDTASGNGIHVARITDDGVDIEGYEDIDAVL